MPATHEPLAEPLELLAMLRDELRARSLDQAPSCPSWRVYADWLLEHGDPRGEWLALALAPELHAEHERLAEVHMHEHDRRLGAGAISLAALRGNQGLHPRSPSGWSRWFGPFVLAAVGPQFERSRFDAALGRHGALLLPERALIGQAWLARALERVPSPTLVPLDAALVQPVTDALGSAVQRERKLDLLVAAPGAPMPVVMPPISPINPGPVFDPEAMRQAYADMHARNLARMLERSCALLSCLDDADLDRHAADWPRLQQLGCCVILGPSALLDRWPHPSRTLALG